MPPGDLCSIVSISKAVERITRRAALGILRAVAGRTQGLPPLRPSELRRVLLIRYDRLGDAVITTSVIAALRELAPDVEIDVLASNGNRIIFENDPRVGSVLIWDGSPLGILRTIRAARSRRYDAVFQLILNRTTLPALLAGLMAPHGRTIGKSMTGHDVLFNHTAPTPQEHFSDRTVALLAAGIQTDPARLSSSYSLAIPARDREQAERGLAGAGLARGNFILLNISAGSPDRELSDAMNSALAVRLVELGVDLAVIGGPEAWERVGRIASAAGGRPLRFSSLLAAAAAVGEALMLVTPDTSMVHIASAMRTPVVAAFAPGGDPGGWGPRDVAHRIVRIDNKSGKHGGVESIAAAAADLLEELRPE